MRIFGTAPLAMYATLLLATQALAQTPAALPSGVPEKMPFDIPYGAPISLDVAKAAAEAAHAEARRRGWKLAIAVVSPAGDLTYFIKMDDTQLVSTTIAQNKAKTAARFRRESRVFFDQMESGHPYVSTLDPILSASPGGIPIIVGGHLIGGIGCSGGAGTQDEVACKAGAAAVSR